MAGNARFHDKHHRTNHHTLSTAGIPDSATDPIAGGFSFKLSPAGAVAETVAEPVYLGTEKTLGRKRQR
jgi:hypothetical protein